MSYQAGADRNPKGTAIKDKGPLSCQNVRVWRQTGLLLAILCWQGPLRPEEGSLSGLLLPGPATQAFPPGWWGVGVHWNGLETGGKCWGLGTTQGSPTLPFSGR